MPRWRESPPARRSTPHRGSPTRHAPWLYIDLELIAVARDGASRGLHDRHGAPCLCRGHCQHLADHMAWDEALAVTPAEARRTVAVMEAAARPMPCGRRG